MFTWDHHQLTGFQQHQSSQTGPSPRNTYLQLSNSPTQTNPSHLLTIFAEILHIQYNIISLLTLNPIHPSTIHPNCHHPHLTLKQIRSIFGCTNRTANTATTPKSLAVPLKLYPAFPVHQHDCTLTHHTQITQCLPDIRGILH